MLNEKKLIQTAEAFSKSKVTAYYEFPRYYLCFCNGWDGVIKLDKETGKASTFDPMSISAEEFRKATQDAIKVGSKDSIAHHGILKQRWGKRNGPPYPLHKDAHTKAQIKAAKKAGIKVGGDSGTYMGKKKKEAMKGRTKGLFMSVAAKAIEKSMYDADYDTTEDAGEKKSSAYYDYWDSEGNERRQRTALGNVSDAQARELSLYTVDTEDGQEDEEVWANPLTIIMDNRNHDKTLKTDDGYVTDEMLADCNPTKGMYGSTNNCSKSTFALEMRSRGYDVSAGRCSTNGCTYNSQSFWWKNAPQPSQFTGDNAESRCMDEVESYGDRSSGEIRVAFRKDDGGSWGHSMHFTNDKEHGFEIQDGQTGERYHSLDEFYEKHDAQYGHNSIRNCVAVTRLDDCEPNWTTAARDSCIRENPKNKNVRESAYESDYVGDSGDFHRDLIDDTFAQTKGERTQAGAYINENSYVMDARFPEQHDDRYQRILDNYGDWSLEDLDDDDY